MQPCVGIEMRFLTFASAECTARIEMQQPWLLAAVLGALLWYLLSPVGVSAVVLVCLVLLLVVSYLWARTLAVAVRGERKLRYGAFQVGDELEEVVRLHNDSILPVIWAEFADRSSLPGHAVRSVRAVDGHSTQHWTARTICRQRGVFQLGPWELLLGEPFGVFVTRQLYAQPVEVLVYPPLADLPSRLWTRRGRHGDGRPDRQPLTAETTQAFAVRSYQTGDALRQIHWLTSARRDALYVKMLQPETVSSIWLVPDFDSAAQFGEVEAGTLEFLVVLTASLAGEMLRAKLRVGLAGWGQAGLVCLAPQTGQSQFWRMLRLLAGVQAGQVALSDLLGRLRPLVSAQSVVMPLTATQTVDWAGAAAAFGPGGCQAVLVDGRSFAGQALNADDLQRVLVGRGIAASVVRREELRLRLGAYGRLSRWEFRTLGTGRALLQHAPAAMGQSR